jgi:serine/threonine protein kinase
MSEKRIGEYYLSDKVLGEGSFSTVYLGYGANDEKVAVKVIPRHTLGNDFYYSLEHYPSTI